MVTSVRWNVFAVCAREREKERTGTVDMEFLSREIIGDVTYEFWLDGEPVVRIESGHPSEGTLVCWHELRRIESKIEWAALELSRKYILDNEEESA